MEHYIELIDGTHIEAFPKAVQPETIKEDKFVLDTTGEYLQIGRRKRMLKRSIERDTIAQQRGTAKCCSERLPFNLSACRYSQPRSKLRIRGDDVKPTTARFFEKKQGVQKAFAKTSFW